MSSASPGAHYVLAVDVGGTFTDVIRHDTVSGAVEVAKTASTPPDFIEGMLAGIEAVGARPADIRLIKIGTTIATNTVIMRTGARTALVTTAGFTDVLHAARASRPTLYDSDWDPAPALVDRRDTMTVAQRTTYEGEVLEPLDEAGLRRVAARLRERGIEAVAVSFLHSYINDAHERRAQAILSQEMPGGYVCRSSLNPLGVKGVGEGGATPAGAVEDALEPFGATIRAHPLDPPAVLALIVGDDEDGAT